MNAKSILILILCIAAGRWYFSSAESDEDWLRKQMAFEQREVVGKVFGDFKGERVYQGPGKSITFEYTNQVYNRDAFNMTSEAIEAELRPRMKAIMEGRPELKQYTDRKIKVNVNFYTRDGRMLASLTM